MIGAIGIGSRTLTYDARASSEIRGNPCS
jgi:hypothetical protein